MIRTLIFALLLATSIPAPLFAQSDASSPTTDADAQGSEQERPAMDGLLPGDAPWIEAHNLAMLRGRDAYNSDDLEEARKAFIAAIQAAPESPAPYRNLARTLYWLEDFSAATAHYAHYLELADNPDDAATIEQESRTAARQANADFELPADQRMALRSLRRELDQGRAITTGGGGAFGLYLTLLRMGYATPNLLILRRELEENLSDEFEARLEVTAGFIPIMSSEDWLLQQERIDAIEALTRSTARLGWIEKRRLLVDALDALLSGRYGDAATTARQAAHQNPDLPYLRWYEVVALEQSRQPAEALAVLEDLLSRGTFTGEARRQIEVFRAQLLQHVGRNQEAAQIYKEILLSAGNPAPDS